MKLGILGYGNLGRGVELAVKQNDDVELVAVFTRRNPETLKINSDAEVVHVSELENYKSKIDVLLLSTFFSSSAIFLANSSLNNAVSSLVPIEAPISS